MANWVGDGWQSDYGPVRDRRGACWYVLRDADGKRAFQQNPNWHLEAGNGPVVKRAQDILPEAFRGAGPMYHDFLACPERYRFLVDPALA